MSASVHDFLAARPVAVVGASIDRAKYGNIVLRNLRARGWKDVYAINPAQPVIEGEPAYPRLAECPQRPELVVVITPPKVSLKIVEQAAELGIKKLWFQPGAESGEAIQRAEELGLETIHDACIMVQAARA